MGFSFGQAITGAISGAASGFMMGGGNPLGAVAGGVLGGAAGGFGIGGGPSSVGGITGPGGGSQAGTSAREYYDEAFPGTNPWERLGAGNPIGALGSAAINAQTAKRNVDVQTRAQTQNVVTQASAGVRIAQINAASAGNVAGIQGATGRDVAATSAAAPGRVATTGEGKLEVERGHLYVARKELVVKQDQVKINKQLQRLKSLEMDIKTAEMAKNPAIAAVRAQAVKIFESGIRDQEKITNQLVKNYPALLGLGTVAEIGSWVAHVVGGSFGAKVRGVALPKKTSLRGGKPPRPKPPGGGEKSAPSGYRPPGPDAATQRSREYWMGLKK